MLILTKRIPDDYIKDLKEVIDTNCCYRRSQYHIGLVDLLYEFKLIMYRLTEYNRGQGIMFITEVINIKETPEVPFYGRFTRNVDPFMHVS